MRGGAIVAEGTLIALWMLVLGNFFLMVKLFTRHTWVSNSLALITPGASA